MKTAIKDSLKMVGAIVAFLVVYGLADWLGGITPMWIGLGLLLLGIAGLIKIAIKIAKDGL
jgi:hypothetical protein